MEKYFFSDLKVLDVGTWIAGPVAGTILADFGASVIKVEMPDSGDQYRMLSGLPGTPDADVNYCWEMDARNKKSLTLNLKTGEGMAILHRLIESCDVYITNHPLPMRRSLKLNYADIKAINPGIIYASLTAYGEEGPDRDREGFDLVAYWARTGLMDLVREPDMPPASALPGMGDHPSAVALYAGIVTALLKKERTGEGSMVSTSLLANGLWSLSCIAQAGFAGGSYERYRQLRRFPSFARAIYETKDHRWLQITMIRSHEELELFLRLLSLNHLLEEARFSTPEGRLENAGDLVSHIRESILCRHSGEWMQLFEENGLNVTRVGLVEELMHDDQIRINDMVVEPRDKNMGIPWVINHPVKIDSIPQVGPQKAPEIGQHTEEILMDLGMDLQAIRDLKEKGIV